MKPKYIDDFFPLVEIETKALERYKRRIINEGNTGENNHIYYFSEKLNVNLFKKCCVQSETYIFSVLDATK